MYVEARFAVMRLGKMIVNHSLRGGLGRDVEEMLERISRTVDSVDVSPVEVDRHHLI